MSRSNGFRGRGNGPNRILFVGNSLTYRGGGLDNHLRWLLPDIVTGRVVKGGATLGRLLPLAEEEVLNGSWDCVVFQDDLPETTIEEFQTSVDRAAVLARRGRAEPLLLMTWPYPRLGWIGISGIVEAHRRAGEDSGIGIIPAGLAWEAVSTAGYETDLYDSDNEHPSKAGSFLAAACAAMVIAGTFSPGNPEEAVISGEIPSEAIDPDSASSPLPSGLGEEQCRFLLKTARSVAGQWLLNDQ